MTKPCALLVDDEPDILELLSITLGRMDIDCVTAQDLSEARAALQSRSFSLCLTDMKLPDGNGLDLVTHIQTSYAHTPVAVITAHGSMESAIQALKSGAFDFVNKPVDLADLRSLVTQAIKLDAGDSQAGERLIGDSVQIERLRTTIAKLARSQAPVYISGESGTGKELVARLIHEQGPRASQAFVPVNCGAIPHELMESELFGHLKGSFTGAHGDKKGLFQAADGGTLFLDEVGELPLPMQVKLLRAIQEKRIRPVGGQKEAPIDCRILSATHKDLAALVEHGDFRQDLYYRINVIELKVPALRERRGDIDLLVGHFLARLSPEGSVTLSSAAKQALTNYAFPGNVRELENILERAVTLCEGCEVNARDLQLPEVEPQDDVPRAAVKEEGELKSYLDEVERQRILAALEQTRWNKTQAAKLLGISFRALRYRLEKLGLD